MTSMPLQKKGLALAITGALTLMLSACGGGGGGGNIVQPAPAPPPPTGGTPSVPADSSLTRPLPPTMPGTAAPLVFADPSVNQHLILTNAAGALAEMPKGSGVTIGFVDSGVNTRHVTLAGRVTRNFIRVNPDANNTSVDDVVGHGTTVASLAAGRPVTGNYVNESGATVGTARWGGGIAQNATIVSSRIIADKAPEDDGSGAGNEIRAGQNYGPFFRDVNAQLANAGARIINNSWGGLYWNDPALTIELADAWKDFVVNRQGIVVFASGNSGRDARYRAKPSDNAMLPSMDGGDPVLERGWITVGALDPDNPTQLTAYSQECGPAKNYCMVAPGTNVFIDPDATTQSTSTLWRGGGTSYAAPLVSGALALVWSHFPWLTNDQVRQTVLGTAKDLGAPGVDDVFGWGLLDVTRASWGPGNFAWGDFDANVSGNSVWRNNIVGAGGLIKRGTGTLTLAESQSYTGATRVDAGALDIRKGLAASALTVGTGGTVYASGQFARNVSNAGHFFNDRNAGAVLAGNYQQTSGGNLGVWLGTPLQVRGTATLNGGQVSVLGIRSGYTTQAKEILLKADGGLSGTFARIRSAPNVFLDATLGYDANSAFVNITRVNVRGAAMAMGLSATSLSGAGRVESAMGAIDAGARVGNGFLAAAGDIQQTPDARWAERTLGSLSGQMHAASLAMTAETADAARRSMAERFDALAENPRLAGAWARDLRANGNLAQAGQAALGHDAAGLLLGQDVRIGRNGVVGLAVAQADSSSWMGTLGERSRGRQLEGRAYAGWLGAGAWLQGGLGAGRFDRGIERHLQLGLRGEGVETRAGGRYLFANLEGGHRFGLLGGHVSPYLGTQYLDVRNTGFHEFGGDGFGLRAEGWSSHRWQAHAGLRATRDWRLANGWQLGLDGRAEWQRTLDWRDGLMASFTGIEQWLPVTGLGLAERGRLLALGMDLRTDADRSLRLDVSQRDTVLGSDRAWVLRYRHGF